jgi:hypothetical protein
LRRAIDIPEGKDVDASAFKALVREAVALNTGGKAAPKKEATAKKAPPKKAAAKKAPAKKAKPKGFRP